MKRKSEPSELLDSPRSKRTDNNDLQQIDNWAKKIQTPILHSNGRLNSNDSRIDSQATLNNNSNGTFAGRAFFNKTFFFTGNVEKVIKWGRSIKEDCYFEVIGTIISLRENSAKQRIILLKDQKGPVLQVIHFMYHVIEFEDFTIGQVIRCVGYINGPNVLTAVSIRLASAEELTTLKRYCHISDFSISGLANDM